jgi:HAD superfamily hydrolase (TIGR01509 family)
LPKVRAWVSLVWRLRLKSEPIDLRAACFDLDGTLVDSGLLHVRAEHAALASLGISEPAEDHPVTFGHGIMPGMQMLADHYGLPSGQHVFDAYLPAWESLFADGIASKPGADDLLRRLDVAKVPMALVTSGEREYVDKVLAQFQWNELFDQIVTLESVKRLKPDPESYLLAAKLLRLQPDKCVGFEDSPSGLASLEAAGLFAIYVSNLPAPAELNPDLAVTSLVELDADEFSRIFTL